VQPEFAGDGPAAAGGLASMNKRDPDSGAADR
jgi:hypothetical protein